MGPCTRLLRPRIRSGLLCPSTVRWTSPAIAIIGGALTPEGRRSPVYESRRPFTHAHCINRVRRKLLSRPSRPSNLFAVGGVAFVPGASDDRIQGGAGAVSTPRPAAAADRRQRPNAGIAARSRSARGALGHWPSRKYRINDDTGRSGQGLGSWLCAVHLKDVCGDIHGGVVIHALKLEEWITGGNLKPGYEFDGGFLSPTAEEDFPSQRGDVIGSSNELLIGSRQRCDGWKLTVFTLAPEQGVGMAFPATIFVCCAAGLSLSSGEDNGCGRLLGGSDEP